MIKKTLLVVCLLFYSFWSYDYFSFSKKEYDKLTLPTINWDLLRFWEIKQAKALEINDGGGTHLTFSNFTNFDLYIEDPEEEFLNYNQLFDGICLFTVTSLTFSDDSQYDPPSCNSETSSAIAFGTLFTAYARESGDNSDCYLISHDGSNYASNKTNYNECALVYGDELEPEEPEDPLIAMIWQLFNTLLSVLPFALAGLLMIVFTYWSFQKVLELFNAYKTVRQDRNDYKMLNPDNVKKKEAREQLKRIVNPKIKKDFYK